MIVKIFLIFPCINRTKNIISSQQELFDNYVINQQMKVS